jgi:hypothetical protein
VGKPNERERVIYYSALGKYISAAKQHFQPRKIPHSTKSVPQKSASFSMPKPYRCHASFVPRFLCPQSTVRIVLYGPKTTIENPKITSKTIPKIASIFVPNPYGCTDPYSTASTAEKKNSAKNHKKKIGNRAHFPRKMRPLCCSLSSLKLAQKISLTLLPMSSLDI